MKNDYGNNETEMPEGYSSVNVEFTKEEAEAIAEYFDVVGSIANQHSEDDTDLYAPEKFWSGSRLGLCLNTLTTARIGMKMTLPTIISLRTKQLKLKQRHTPYTIYRSIFLN